MTNPKEHYYLWRGEHERDLVCDVCGHDRDPRIDEKDEPPCPGPLSYERESKPTTIVIDAPNLAGAITADRSMGITLPAAPYELSCNRAVPPWAMRELAALTARLNGLPMDAGTIDDATAALLSIEFGAWDRDQASRICSYCGDSYGHEKVCVVDAVLVAKGLTTQDQREEARRVLREAGRIS